MSFISVITYLILATSVAFFSPRVALTVLTSDPLGHNLLFLMS